MIPSYLSPLANHLWQSTVFAAAAGLLTLAFKNSRAAVRYGIWLAASLKFLVPFALLAALGGQIAWRKAPEAPPPALTFAVDQIGRPFSAATTLAPGPAPARNGPRILFAVWLCGFLAIVLAWTLRWRRIRRAVRAATPLELNAPIPGVCSPSRLEPGIVGIFQPVLLLPEGIGDRLTPAQWAAILAHELCHAARRDNLTSAIHMAVEAIFWFHPLVWWIGTRLVNERERACDEAVLLRGCDRESYAEGILKVCKFYLESPLTCAAGVTGADLKKRMEEIMTRPVMRKLDVGKKLLLAAALTAAAAAPVLIGVMESPRLLGQSQPAERLAFEVASIKENKTQDARDGRGLQFLPGGRFVAKNIPLIILISSAYNLPPQTSRLTSAPGVDQAIRQAWFSIEATAPPGAITESTTIKTREEKMRLMLQTLLADRFKLVMRRETKEEPVYAAVVARGGPKLQKAAVDEKDCKDSTSGPNDPAWCHGFAGGQGQGLRGPAVSISDLVSAAENFADRPVIDKTGLQGLFNIQTEGWVPMRPRPPRPPGQDPTAEDLAFADPARPTLFQIFDRLGLKLESTKAPVEVFVIEHIERPSDN
ncbi:MAG: TIGR03435 family protein [Bryobacterales bacterium]|nr:TIGR03435 family protein [Bryobacterales bacterium]MBV9398173.1 TIGR03435 family protein [Bryobacterales bacterium]